MQLNITVNESEVSLSVDSSVSMLDRNHLRATVSLVWCNTKRNERKQQRIKKLFPSINKNCEILAVFGHEVRCCPANVLPYSSVLTHTFSVWQTPFPTACGDQSRGQTAALSLVFWFAKGTINNVGISLGIRSVILLVALFATESKDCKTSQMFLCK